MGNLVLMLSVASVFVLGYLLSKRLELFLSHNSGGPGHHTAAPWLRIGVESPALLDAMADFWEQFSQENPGCQLSLFYADANKILQAVQNHHLDFGFVLESSLPTSSPSAVNMQGVNRSSPLLSQTIPIRQASSPPPESPAPQIRAIWQAGGGSHAGKPLVRMLRAFSQRPLGKPAAADDKPHKGVV